jgi:hypothetical protein
LIIKKNVKVGKKRRKSQLIIKKNVKAATTSHQKNFTLVLIKKRLMKIIKLFVIVAKSAHKNAVGIFKNGKIQRKK